MNALRQQTLNETAGSFHDVTTSRLQVSDLGRHRALGVFLADWLQPDPGLLHQVVPHVVSKGTVSIDNTAGGQIKEEAGQCPHVGVSTRGEKYLDRFTVSGDQQMNSQAIEVAPCAGNVTPVDFFLIEPRPRDADLVTGGDGEAIDDVDRGRIKLFEEFTQHLENGKKQLTNSMQPTVEAAFAEHRRDVTAMAERL